MTTMDSSPSPTNLSNNEGDEKEETSFKEFDTDPRSTPSSSLSPTLSVELTNEARKGDDEGDRKPPPIDETSTIKEEEDQEDNAREKSSPNARSTGTMAAVESQPESKGVRGQVGPRESRSSGSSTRVYSRSEADADSRLMRGGLHPPARSADGPGDAHNQRETAPNRSREALSLGGAHRAPPTGPSVVSAPKQYFVGQWLDVRDTVSQWLEATVMQVEDHSPSGYGPPGRIYVHYNGW